MIQSNLQTTELLNRLQSHSWQEYVQIKASDKPPVANLLEKTPDEMWLERHKEDLEGDGFPSHASLVETLRDSIDV